MYNEGTGFYWLQQKLIDKIDCWLRSCIKEIAIHVKQQFNETVQNSIKWWLRNNP